VRFISKSAKYQTCFKRDVVEHFATGESRTLQPLWNIEFQPDGWLAHELAEAKARFINRGLPTELDEVTTVDPTYRFGSFDTAAFQREHASEGFDDARRVEMEEWLLQHPDYGHMFFEVAAPTLDPPWPTYDKFRGNQGMALPARIAEKVREDGYDVGEVLAYERANANREDVVAALEELAAGEPAEELVSA
jgi:hypothetical protein